MTISRPLTDNENPMTTYDQPTARTYRSRSTAMNLINEALSRARMRKPQDEAYRSARRVAMQARRRQAHDLGDISQLMPR